MKPILILTLMASLGVFMYRSLNTHKQSNVKPNQVLEAKPKTSDYISEKNLLVRLNSDKGIKAYELDFKLYSSNSNVKTEIDNMGSQFENMISMTFSSSTSDTLLSKKGQNKVGRELQLFMNDFLTQGEVLSVTYIGAKL